MPSKDSSAYPCMVMINYIVIHLDSFGQQIFDLDFVTPTLSEQPEILFANFQSLLARDTAATADTEVLAREREALTEETAARLGPVRRWMFTKALGWAQKYAPYREAALFHMGAAWPLLRQMARHLGERLVALEALDQALQKGGLNDRKTGEAYLLRGMAWFNLGDYDRAGADWSRAGRHEKSREAARQWMNHLQEEQRRTAS